MCLLSVLKKYMYSQPTYSIGFMILLAPVLLQLQSDVLKLKSDGRTMIFWNSSMYYFQIRYLRRMTNITE